jgi:circadian clock protein KaiB
MDPSTAAPLAPFHEFHLYVSGATPNSTRALRNIKEICEQYLAGSYVLRIIDLYEQPELAQREQIIAAPMLVRYLPLPRRRLVGDLSNRSAVLAILGLATDHLPPPATP